MKSNLWQTIGNLLNFNINPLSLHFRDKVLEKEFSEDYKTRNVTLAVLSTLLSALLLGLFYLIYTLKHLAWFIVMVALSLVFGLTLYFRMVKNTHNLALFVYSLIVELSYNHRMLFYDGSDKGALTEYFMRLILIVLAVNAFLRLTFFHAILLNAIFFLLFISYGVLGININHADPEYSRYSSLAFLSTVAVIYISIYNNEYMCRVCSFNTELSSYRPMSQKSYAFRVGETLIYGYEKN